MSYYHIKPVSDFEPPCVVWSDTASTSISGEGTFIANVGESHIVPPYTPSSYIRVDDYFGIYFSEDYLLSGLISSAGPHPIPSTSRPQLYKACVIADEASPLYKAIKDNEYVTITECAIITGKYKIVSAGHFGFINEGQYSSGYFSNTSGTKVLFITTPIALNVVVDGEEASLYTCLALNFGTGVKCLSEICSYTTFIWHTELNNELSAGSTVIFNNSIVIPELVNWLALYAERVYEECYTVESSTGEPLASVTDAPPMTSATLSTIDNSHVLTLVGEDNKTYSLSWTSTPPDGYAFIGLSTVQAATVPTIPNNDTVTIDIPSSTTFYEVYGRYPPIPEAIEAGVYQNTADARVVDKSSYLDKIAEFNGVIRDDCDVVHPVVRLQYDTVPDFNYVGIAELNRYYFVTDVKYIAKGLWDIYLECDVLMTWKDGIRQCTAFVDRNAFPPEESNYITDTQRVVEQGEDVTTVTFSAGELTFGTNREYCYVLDAYYTYGSD